MTRIKSAFGAVCLALTMLAGCGGGGPQTVIEAQAPLGPAGDWIWMFSKSLGCPEIEAFFEFTQPNNPVMFQVVETGTVDNMVSFETPQPFAVGNSLVSLNDGMYDSLTGEVTACFTVREIGSVVVGNGVNLGPGMAYITAPIFGAVVPFDLTTATAGNPIQGFDQPRDMGVTPDGSQVIVPNWAGDSITIIDTSNNSTNTFPSAGLNRPLSVAVHPNGQEAYILCEPTNEDSTGLNAYIQIFDLASSQFLEQIQLNSDTPTALCMSPDGSRLIALLGSAGMDIVDPLGRSVVTALSATVDGACQCAFTPNGALLAVVGSGGLAVHDVVALGFGQAFQTYNLPGWDVDITPDGQYAYVTAGDKGIPLVASVQGPVRKFDMNARTEVAGPDIQGGAWGIDMLQQDYAFYAQGFQGAAINLNDDSVMGMGGQFETPRYARVAQPTQPPLREIKIQFTGFLAVLNQQRQLDGRSEITLALNFQFACQTPNDGDNTWTFIDDSDN